MKTMIARAVVIGTLLAAGTANAQWYETYRPHQSMYVFNYEVSAPVGSFSDNYISSTSWRVGAEPAAPNTPGATPAVTTVHEGGAP